MLALFLAVPLPAQAEEEAGVVVSQEGIPLVARSVGSSGAWVTTPCGRLGHLHNWIPVDDVDVVLDPGHGGTRDTGAVGYNGLPEKELNLRVAEAAKAILEDRGVGVLLTRTGDYASRLWVRAAIGDRSGAHMMLSLHHNAPRMPSSTSPGTEVFVQDGSPESARLGGLAYRSVVDFLSAFDAEWVAAPDAGVMTVLNTQGIDAYGMLRHPNLPTALVELGYMANPAEADLFQTPEYVEAAAAAIVAAVEAFLASEESTVELGEGRVFNPRPGIPASLCVDPDVSGLTSLMERRARVEPESPTRSGFRIE